MEVIYCLTSFTIESVLNADYFSMNYCKMKREWYVEVMNAWAEPWRQCGRSLEFANSAIIELSTLEAQTG